MTTLLSEANARQVGGEHYKTTNGAQHWDLFGPDYLIGYATKYMRWRKKGGVQDLEKAIHVIEKLREVITAEARLPMYDSKMVDAWCAGAELDWVECKIVHLIMFARGSDDLDEAVAGIRHLIQTAGVEPPKIVTAPKIKTTDDRRVPRRVDTPSCGDGLADVHARQRTPEDGAQHAGVTPWVVTREWLGRQDIGNDMIDCYWSRRTADVYVLEPHVTAHNIPRVLRPCYNLGGTGWTLNIRRCPPDARGYFPNLEREKNMTEWTVLPEWQRLLYEWDDQGNKYSLTETNATWHVETE